MSTPLPTFEDLLRQTILHRSREWHDDNHDEVRFGPEKWSNRQLLYRFLARPGRTMAPFFSRRAAAQALRFLRPCQSQLEWLYDHLDDAESRNVLLQVLAYRALGKHRVRLPVNCPTHWANVKRAESLVVPGESVRVDFLDWELPLLDLSPIGYPLRLFFRPSGVVTQFIEEQYRCQSGGTCIQVEPGDVVIDAGACWGDTGLYFAHRCGDSGRVVSFEFLPSNLQLNAQNMALNPNLAPRITLVQQPLWSNSNFALRVHGDGPAAKVEPALTGAPDAITATTIDETCERLALPKVDFIKMDIEGAELEALHGAESCLCRHRPKLAVTVYHRLRDFWEIPRYIDSLGLGYQFHLRHFTPHAEETVLFARCD